MTCDCADCPPCAQLSEKVAASAADSALMPYADTPDPRSMSDALCPRAGGTKRHVPIDLAAYVDRRHLRPRLRLVLNSANENEIHDSACPNRVVIKNNGT